MSKDEILINNTDFFAWHNYEDQTQMKHLILKDYFTIWLKKIR